MAKSKKKKTKSEEEIFAEISPDAYNEICTKFEVQSHVLSETFMLIYKAGLMNELSQQARHYLSNSPWIQNIIQSNEGPNLEPRLSPKEYIEHLARIMNIPGSQIDFLSFIVKTCYIMIMTEKNPLVAQELRGASSITHAIEDVINVR
jgi:hypothetical protein